MKPRRLFCHPRPIFTKGQKISDVDKMCAHCNNMGVQSPIKELSRIDLIASKIFYLFNLSLYIIIFLAISYCRNLCKVNHNRIILYEITINNSQMRNTNYKYTYM